MADISDLIGDGQNGASQQKMEESRALPIRKLKERDDQPHETYDRGEIEQRRH